jgi:mRNA interferase RelE/StbE
MKKKQGKSTKLPGVQAESYAIVIKTSAQKELLGLAKNMAAKVIVAIDNLSHNPRPIGVKKLKGSKEDDFYRIRG